MEFMKKLQMAFYGQGAKALSAKKQQASHAAAIAILMKPAKPPPANCSKDSRRGNREFFRARLHHEAKIPIPVGWPPCQVLLGSTISNPRHGKRSCILSDTRPQNCFTRTAQFPPLFIIFRPIWNNTAHCPESGYSPEAAIPWEFLQTGCLPE